MQPRANVRCLVRVDIRSTLLASLAYNEGFSPRDFSLLHCNLTHLATSNTGSLVGPSVGLFVGLLVFLLPLLLLLFFFLVIYACNLTHLATSNTGSLVGPSVGLFVGLLVFLLPLLLLLFSLSCIYTIYSHLSVFTSPWDHLDVVVRLDSLRGDQRSLLL